jgi:hypothetical protein
MVTDGILASQLALGTPGSAASGLSAGSVERFQQAYSRATSQVDGADASSQGSSAAAALLNPLLSLNSDSTSLALQADRAAAQSELKPGELMMLTMRSHEFLFHCELTANVANRSSDGLQQLFRQQS